MERNVSVCVLVYVRVPLCVWKELSVYVSCVANSMKAEGSSNYPVYAMSHLIENASVHTHMHNDVHLFNPVEAVCTTDAVRQEAPPRKR